MKSASLAPASDTGHCYGLVAACTSSKLILTWHFYLESFNTKRRVACNSSCSHGLWMSMLTSFSKYASQNFSRLVKYMGTLSLTGFFESPRTIFMGLNYAGIPLPSRILSIYLWLSMIVLKLLAPLFESRLAFALCIRFCTFFSTISSGSSPRSTYIFPPCLNTRCHSSLLGGTIHLHATLH